MENENQSSFESFELHLNNEAVGALKESAKWSYFLSILGFVGIGFMVLLGLMMGSIMASMPSQVEGPFSAIRGFMSAFYVIMALIYFFPVYYLFKYASGMKKALNSKDSDLLSNSLVNLKSHHKFLGVTALVMISLYILIIIGGIIFGISSKI